MTKLPRRTMRDPFVRRFEHDLVRACHESFVVQPWLCKPPLRAATYIQQFQDARRGLKLGLWKSDLLPLDANLARVRLHELADGTVQVEGIVAAATASRSMHVDLDGIHLYTDDTLNLARIIDCLHNQTIDGFKCPIYVHGDLEAIKRLIGDRDVSIEVGNATRPAHRLY